MTKLVTLLGLTLASVSHAATLAPGETLNINGTQISCQSSSEARCSLDASVCSNEGAVKVRVGTQAMTTCLWLKDALVQLKALKDAGACD